MLSFYVLTADGGGEEFYIGVEFSLCVRMLIGSPALPPVLRDVDSFYSFLRFTTRAN